MPGQTGRRLGVLQLGVAEDLAAHRGQTRVVFDQLRAQAETSLASAKVKLEDLHEDLIEKGREAVKATDDYVQENPWKAVGIAAGIGLVIGLLVSRR